MSDIRVRQLVNPTAEDLDQAAATLALAYADDAATRMMTGGDASRVFALRRAMLAGYDAIGEIWVADAPGRAMAGVAAFVRPGKDSLDNPEGRASMAALLGALPEDVQRWWLEGFMPAIVGHELSALGEGTGKKAWNLYNLGTHPEYQRRGIGRALTNVINRKASADQTLVTLRVAEAGTHALEYYRRLGYKERGEPAFIESPWGSAWTRLMIREP